MLISSSKIVKSIYDSLNPDTPPDTMNFMAAGPEILSGIMLSLGTKK